MRIALCLPGESWGTGFLRGLVETTTILASNGIEVLLSSKYTSIVSSTRNQVAGGAALFGAMQVPFNGEVEYDYMLWIDSDQTFHFEDVAKLLEHQKDFCAGWCLTKSKNSNVCIDQDEDRFRDKGSYLMMHQKDIERKSVLFDVAFVGFGMVLIKRGVFEKIAYPWFSFESRLLNNGVRKQLGEDVSFCNKATEAGFTIWVDPTVRVGHVKSITI